MSDVKTFKHSCLPPFSCHSPAMFKGFVQGIGTRLHMICSEDEDLDRRLEEYGRHLTVSRWKYRTAKERLVEGVKKDREKLLNQPRKRKHMKIVWVCTYNPRVPSKTAIIKKNLHLLHASVVNKEIFPPRTIILADRKRKKSSTNVQAYCSTEICPARAQEQTSFFSFQRKVRHLSPFKRNHCSCISVGW